MTPDLSDRVCQLLREAARRGATAEERWLPTATLYERLPECESEETLLLTLARLHRQSRVQRVVARGRHWYADRSVVGMPARRAPIEAPGQRATNPNRGDRPVKPRKRRDAAAPNFRVIATGDVVTIDMPPFPTMILPVRHAIELRREILRAMRAHKKATA
mgnify:CR=1 FL=1